MPSSFEEFESGDIVTPGHLKQIFPVIRELEAGQSYFRPDIGTINAYKLDFSETYSESGNAFSDYVEGHLILFQAGTSNTAAATLRLAGTDSGGSPIELAPKPLLKNGGQPLEAGDIDIDQIVAVVYNSEGSGYFEIVSELSLGLDAADMASGTLLLERGGTGSDLGSAGPGYLYFSSAGSPVVARSLGVADLGAGLLPVAHGGTGAALRFSRGYLHLEGGEIQARWLDTGDLQSGVMPVERGGTGLASYAKGDLLTWNGTELEPLETWLDDQVLFAHSGVVPNLSWKSPDTGSETGLYFGDGSDGSVTFSSDTELLENRYYQDLTIESGVNLRTNGFKIYVRGTLTLDGTISFNGNHAAHASGSSPGSPGAGTSYTNWDSAAGAPGSLNQGSDAIPSPPGVYCAHGGDGGAGDAGPGGDGSNSGNITYRPDSAFRSLSSALSGLSDGGLQQIGSVYTPGIPRGGMGGAGGSGDGASAAGGSGGGGGGVLWIAARSIHGNGSGVLSAQGGDGGNAGGSDAGGGGGGGGGLIYVLSGELDYIHNVDVSGGAGGLGAGSGIDGAAGGPGTFVFLGDL